jgi:DNA-binding transcriptional ArsR family regulator
MESATHLDVVAAGLQGFGHPLRIRALVLLEGESSPRELAELLDAPLGVVSYHVRMLRDYGLVKCTRTAPVRGALQHYYERTELADELLSHLRAPLNVPARKRGTQGQGRRDALIAWATDAVAA